MPPSERSVLILGDEPSLVDRFVPLLRRSNLAVRRLSQPSGPIQLAEEAPRDLIIIAPPIANAARLFGRARAPGSPWRHTGVLLIAERGERAGLDPALTRFANRMVSPGATPEEFEQAVSDLLEVAPRVAVHASVQLKLVPTLGAPKSLPIENLSSTGMFLAVDEPLPVGTVFGFALDLPPHNEPIRGQAGVVRKAPGAAGGRGGIGVRFLSLGGNGAERIDQFVRRQPRRAGQTVPGHGSAATISGVIARPLASDLEPLRQELVELESLLNGLLQQGLARRLGVTDWYLTGMELGLDSLHAFSALLEAVHGGRAAAFDTQARIADLALVRRKLAEFAHQQELRLRIQLLLDLRPPLERLLRELASSRGSGAHDFSPTRAPEAVTQVVAEIRRLIGLRKSVERVRSLLVELGATRLLFAPGAQRRLAERIWQEYNAHAAGLGFSDAARLVERKDRNAALLAVDRELKQLDQRLTAIHEKVYAKRFHHLASGNVEADLSDPRTLSILTETVAPGLEYLARAFSAYRHALELIGSESGLLERAADLASTLRAAERAAGTTVRSARQHLDVQGA